jgi:hypothetical protein
MTLECLQVSWAILVHPILSMRLKCPSPPNEIRRRVIQYGEKREKNIIEWRWCENVLSANV